jgi:hypothetical protein
MAPASERSILDAGLQELATSVSNSWSRHARDLQSHGFQAASQIKDKISMESGVVCSLVSFCAVLPPYRYLDYTVQCCLVSSREPKGPPLFPRALTRCVEPVNDLLPDIPGSSGAPSTQQLSVSCSLVSHRSPEWCVFFPSITL